MESAESVLKSEKKRSNRNCCVVNCSNTERKYLDLHFYVFPNRPWEKERRIHWINAVRWRLPGCKSWNSTAYTRICSAHMHGGEKFNNPLQGTYNPTIFPGVYQKPKESYSNRTERLLARKQTLSTLNSNVSINIDEDLTSNMSVDTDDADVHSDSEAV
ncbi:hypothetical protein PV325_012522 [Microctonus aethiopoides]|nr:hypothetical protein PV325_012522 [Microctonus aethiopoides]KAK0083701.1 hypothetical protein PV326_006614 [Microctonus aethiopoides]